MAGVVSVIIGDLALLAVIDLPTGVVNVAFLAPGLVLVGIGQALWITPLTTTVLAHADPQRAGMVSGTLSTMQQLGNSLGVALIGVVFFGDVRRGYQAAFSHALIGLAIGLALAATLTRLLGSTKNPLAHQMPLPSRRSGR
jgi:predicted MFS family arabinose efflux permease